MSGLQPMVLAQFPLAKYSYAETSSDQHGPINWTHVHSSDLNVVFEKEEMTTPSMASFQQRLTLRVVRGREQLEDLDLNNLAREATQQAIARQTRNTKPSVAVLVKDPCLAVRFPSGRDQMHRFQLKFSSSRDYRGALEILREINCPFSETQRDHNLRSASSRPDSSTSRITNSTIPAFTGSVDWGQYTAAPASNRPWSQGLLRSHTATLGASSPNSFLSDLHSRNDITTAITNLDRSQKDASGVRSISQIADHRNQELGRPITAPNFDSQALDQVLPPKRDLPFSKPGPRSSHVANQLSITGSSRHGLPPEPTSDSRDMNTVSSIVTASPRPHTARSRVTVPATSSPARQLRLELEDSRRSSTSQDRGPIPASSPVLGTSLLGVSSPDINNTELHFKATAQSPLRNLTNSSPLAHDSQSVPQQQQQQHQQSQQLNIVNPYLDSNSNNNNGTTPPVTATTMSSVDFSAYLTTPESERSQLVSNWICQQLEDDGFRALCQDVERVWQRIAFGTRSR
ncbi:hypothetical protein UA08_08420 [Talaromyces atroroseus]|uniref:Uncharacterized protein n=1 Tax=Talaromyces atroroseus TaxID=1441469 RepID=A0A1Q5Q7K8_TALAT|nr:hypothetical protein UA08_08420 [Talaromyces atroroseus]OKL56209.1 hypothetical protein UA08_08420 [Talaromyces atroroseus]